MHTDGSMVINNNTVRNNYGPGLWSDGGGWNISYTNNIIQNK
jgi:hypothetical protein